MGGHGDQHDWGGLLSELLGEIALKAFQSDLAAMTAATDNC